MTQRALVQRATTVDDEYGMPGPSTWATHIAALACRFWQDAERELAGPDKSAVVADARAIVPRTADVRESDRINGIVDRRGTVVRAGILLIESVIPRRDHQELVLRGISS